MTWMILNKHCTNFSPASCCSLFQKIVLLGVFFCWGCGQVWDTPVYSRYQQPSRAAAIVVEDALIAARVKSALAADDLVNAKSVKVTVRRGVVHLTGRVKDNAAARMLTHLIRGVTGVRQVENHLALSFK